MAARNKVTVLESFQAAPPPGSSLELSIPLTCADMAWIGFLPVQRLIFYQSPFSKSLFLDTIIPSLKNSLSSALKHFPSLAGNLIVFSDSTNPEIRYADGNSVSVVFSECTSPDFEYLVSDKSRNCTDFYPLVPQLPKSTELGGLKMTPLVSFQVTLFPGKGICIGTSYQHVAGDGNSILSFVKAWSQICKSGKDGDVLFPIYDREVMKVHTKDLDYNFWNDLMNMKSDKDDIVAIQQEFFPENPEKVRTTFVISLEEIQRLKNHVSERKTSLKHLSTFTVVCGYVWVCMTKSLNGVIDKIDDNEEQYFVFNADFRGRIDPMVPANYFGNCLVPIIVIANKMELCGDEGFVTATELIREGLRKRLNKNEDVLHVFRTLLMDIGKIEDMTRVMSVAGSPRQNYYNMDFGWGKSSKVEITSIDSTGAISLAGCRDESGGLEIGLALPKKRMDIFTEIFREGLQALN